VFRSFYNAKKTSLYKPFDFSNSHLRSIFHSGGLLLLTRGGRGKESAARFLSRGRKAGVVRGLEKLLTVALESLDLNEETVYRAGVGPGGRQYREKGKASAGKDRCPRRGKLRKGAIRKEGGRSS